MTFHPIAVPPPEGRTLLVRSGPLLCFAAVRDGRWSRVPDGHELPPPKEYALLEARL